MSGINTQAVPMSSRRHVAIFGETNVGKSSIFNAILGQDHAIVSAEKGTTTDPIIKAMELVPYGPIGLIDTAGILDDTVLGNERVKKTMSILDRTDLAVYVCDINNFEGEIYRNMLDKFDKFKIPHILVFNKADCIEGSSRVKELQEQYSNAIFTSVYNKESIKALKDRIGKELTKIGLEEDSIIRGLVPSGGVVLLVVPIDLAAPKGRLILPQVQLIRDCLDNGIVCIVCKDDELERTLKMQKNIDLVVTDSKVFGKVAKIVPENIMLTSFSMLLARQKGDIFTFIEGARKVESLKNNSRILMAEACTHNTSHEDIGRVKIPNWLRKYTGKELIFEYTTGHQFPQSSEDLSQYDLIVHCGSCMINKKSVLTRSARAKEAQVPITNYGVLIAYLNGILPRCSKVFFKDE